MRRGRNRDLCSHMSSVAGQVCKTQLPALLETPSDREELDTQGQELKALRGPDVKFHLKEYLLIKMISNT